MRTTANQNCKKASDDFMNHEQFYVTHILGLLKEAVLWIRIGFNGEPDPSFHLKADPDPDPGSPPNAYPSGSGSWSDVPSERVEFFQEKHTSVGTKVFEKAGNQVYL
jgi:hypothetical protein